MISQIEKDLREGKVISHPTANLAGRAKKWAGSYHRTWCNAQRNLEAEGYKIGCIPGPRGGTTTKDAKFYLYLPGHDL